MKPVRCQILHQTRLGNHAAHPNQEMLHLILIAPVENRLVLVARDFHHLRNLQNIGIFFKNTAQGFLQKPDRRFRVTASRHPFRANLYFAQKRIFVTKVEEVHDIRNLDGILSGFLSRADAWNQSAFQILLCGFLGHLADFVQLLLGDVFGVLVQYPFLVIYIIHFARYLSSLFWSIAGVIRLIYLSFFSPMCRFLS